MFFNILYKKKIDLFFLYSINKQQINSKMATNNQLNQVNTYNLIRVLINKVNQILNNDFEVIKKVSNDIVKIHNTLINNNKSIMKYTKYVKDCEDMSSLIMLSHSTGKKQTQLYDTFKTVKKTINTFIELCDSAKKETELLKRNNNEIAIRNAYISKNNNTMYQVNIEIFDFIIENDKMLEENDKMLLNIYDDIKQLNEFYNFDN